MTPTEELNPTAARLIELYADLGVDGVKEDADARALLQEHENDDPFNSILNHVKDIAGQLERDTEGQTPAGQVRSALALFNTLKRHSDRQRYAYELALRRYGRYWTQAQKEYMQMACRKLAWKDFFLSFTSHNPADGEVQLVNSQHKDLIIHALGDVFKAPEIVKTNMFARVLRYYLVNGPLTGYYDPEHRGPGEVEKLLRREVVSALAFVQVVQSTMFMKLPSFCMFEYDAAVEDGEPRTMVFVMPGRKSELIRRYAVDNSLHSWYDAIDRAHNVEIEPAEDLAEIKAAVSLIQTQIVRKVAEARDGLIENVPE